MDREKGDFIDSYRKAVDFLYSLQKFGIKFGLNCTEKILHRLGEPQQRFRSIHIAGTNGKGSTGAILSSILRRSGYRVGLYTSPHLVRFTERFRINDREADPRKILDVYDRVKKVLDEGQWPTFFEMVTAMAFEYFAQEKVDWAIIETGMGGRLDATNVIVPCISIITNVSYDHQEFLGKTLSRIAHEKAGIIKPRIPVVTAAKQPVVQSAIKTRCYRCRSPLYRMGIHFKVRKNGAQSFHYHGLQHRWPHLRINLLGDHQFWNAALALASLEVLGKEGWIQVSPSAVKEGLTKIHWPGRLEILEESPLVVLDGAHNAQGAESLRTALLHSFQYDRLFLVMGIMDDKDIRGILRRLLPLAESTIFTQPRYGRAAQPEKIRRLARPYAKRHYVIANPSLALSQAKEMAGPNDIICITGSLYFAGEIKELYGEPGSLLDRMLA